MAKRFVEQNKISLEGIKALKPEEKLGPYPVDYFFGIGSQGEYRQGRVEIVNSEGTVGFRASGELDGERWLARQGGMTPEKLHEKLLSDEFRVAGEEETHEKTVSGIYVVLAGLWLRVGRITNMEQINNLTSALVFGISSGAKQ